MDNPEDSAWVFDSLVGFLHGPVWNAPLQTFIEEKSLIFEPIEDGEIPDQGEYGIIHEEYKNLVDLMLGSYMEDIGITPEQFEAACQLSRDEVGGLPLHFHKRLFQQIWAANDYKMFTRMMTQRNVELQLQALELIEQRSADSSAAEGQEAAIMEQVKRMSLEEIESESSQKSTVNSSLSVNFSDNVNKKTENLKSALDNFQKHIVFKESSTRDIYDNIKHVIIDENITSAAVVDENLQIKLNRERKPQMEDIVERREYLKSQRDKLVAMKREVRQRSLEGAENDRPASALSARSALAGPAAAATPSSMHLRRVLAQRLRSEVVEQPGLGAPLS